MKNFKAKLLGACVFVLALVTACNHGYDKVIPSAPANATGVAYKKPRVLYIIADGARGSSVRDAAIPNITALLPNSIYSWNSLADATSTTDATTWTDMITGVSKTKHNVTTEDFVGSQIANFPSIFARIKQLNPKFRIASFAASAAFKTNLTGGTDVSEGFASDDALKVRMVDFLKTDTAQLVVGEFANIETVGKASGFDNSFPAYKAAIGTFDAQVGELVAAIKSRPTYGAENWMVVIASNKGGAFTLPASQNDNTVFSNTTTNTFTIFYNAGFKTTFIAKPFVGNQYTGTAPRFLGSPEAAIAKVDDPSYAIQRDRVFTNPGTLEQTIIPAPFNFGASRSMSVSIKIKKHKNPVNKSRGEYYYQWPGFAGKRGSANYVAEKRDPITGALIAPAVPATPLTDWGDVGGAGPGWDLCLWQNKWRIFVGGNTDATQLRGFEVQGAEFTGDTWHDLTVVIEVKPDGKKYFRLYTDGIPGISNQNGGSTAVPSTAEWLAPGVPMMDNNSPLRIGYTPGQIDNDFGKIDVELKEFKIFAVALPDLVCKQYACDPIIDRSHPFYDNLVGYWPCNEGTGAKLFDKGPFGADMTMTGTYTWGTFSDLICSPPPVNYLALVPKNTDIPVQLLSWFNIARLSSWALEGKVWISN